MIKGKTLPVRLDRHTDENLKWLAEAEGRTRAGLVRWLVNVYASEKLRESRRASTRPVTTDRAQEAKQCN